MPIATLLILAALLALLALLFLFLMVWFASVLVARAPFVPIPKTVIPQIIEALEPPDSGTLYDLGCGDARVLIECAKQKPNLNYIGIEMVPIPFILAWLKTRKDPRARHVRLSFKSFFKENLRNADRIFIYLFPGIVDDLLLKLEKELKPGAIVVSCDFPFTEKSPEKVIDLHRPKRLLAHKLYIYKF